MHININKQNLLAIGVPLINQKWFGSGNPVALQLNTALSPSPVSTDSSLLTQYGLATNITKLVSLHVIKGQQ